MKWIAALALPLLVGACSFSASVGGNLATDKVETEILNGIEAQTEAEIDSVECPDEVKMEQGNDFECTATDSQGNSAQVQVTQTDDEGNINWELNGGS
jgi:hypothetical protein